MFQFGGNSYTMPRLIHSKKSGFSGVAALGAPKTSNSTASVFILESGPWESDGSSWTENQTQPSL